MGKLVDAARAYLGVKWRHRGRTRQGVDCAGLGVLAYRDCGVELQDWTMYGREPWQDGLITNLTRALGEPLELTNDFKFDDGDVVVLRFVNEPHHVGILAEVDYGGTPALNIIHADGLVGRVVEVRFDDAARKRVTHVYRRAV